MVSPYSHGSPILSLLWIPPYSHGCLLWNIEGLAANEGGSAGPNRYPSVRHMFHTLHTVYLLLLCTCTYVNTK